MASEKNGNGQKIYTKYQSRKWQLVVVVLAIATLGLFVPPALSLFVFEMPQAFFIITGTEWVSVVTLIVAAYFGANVLQKRVERQAFGSGSMMPFGGFGYGVSGVEEVEEISNIDARGSAPDYEEMPPNEEGEA